MQLVDTRQVRPIRPVSAVRRYRRRTEGKVQYVDFVSGGKVVDRTDPTLYPVSQTLSRVRTVAVGVGGVVGERGLGGPMEKRVGDLELQDR